jgi:hypothetical protein
MYKKLANGFTDHRSRCSTMAARIMIVLELQAGLKFRQFQLPQTMSCIQQKTNMNTVRVKLLAPIHSMYDISINLLLRICPI